jgi:hypothetical protein
MSKGTITYTIYREIELTVAYEIEPYVPARISGPPEDCYPAEGGYVEDMTVTVGGQPFEITDEERKEIEEHIERAHDHDADRQGDPDHYYEERRDDALSRDWWDE